MGHGHLIDRRYQLLALFVLVVLFLLPSDGIGIVLCPLKNLSGLDCPTCGLTRSVSSLLHLDFASSLSYHLLGAPALAGLLLVAAPLPKKMGEFEGRARFWSWTYSYRWQIVVTLTLTVWLIRIFSGL